MTVEPICLLLAKFDKQSQRLTNVGPMCKLLNE